MVLILQYTKVKMDSETRVIQEKMQNMKKRNKELHQTSEMIIEDKRGYEIRKVSPLERLLHEFTSFSREKNMIWAQAEADVTEALQKLREYKEKTGESISFTAFIITVFAHVVAMHKYPMNSLIRKNKEIYTFDDVDVMTNIERTMEDGSKRPVSYTFRKAHKKTLKQISNELREAQKVKQVTATSTEGKKRWIQRVVKRLPYYPKFIRYFLLRLMFNNPMLKKQAMGTVNVTAIGMFGTGMGKMIHVTPHALSLGIGGMEKLPFNVDGKVMNRDLVGMTLAMDHSVIDGAPATRFFHDFREHLMYFCHDADWCFKSLE